MNGKYLLDTNIVIALFANENKIIERLEAIENVYIPVIVLGELYFGASKSKKVKKNIKRIETFANNSSILSCDSETAQYYGSIKKGLKVIGKPIPENDIWIAAITKQYELILLTRDEHFKLVQEISLEMA